ncbi:glycosyltransferase family 2 protein [Geodermatophilus sp. SYSU D00710]
MTSTQGDDCAGLGIVIVHFHNEVALTHTLEVLDREGLLSLPVLVVNNGGAVESVTALRRIHPQVRWLELANPGYGAAVNAGVAALPPDVAYICVLTHEVSLTRETARAMVAALAEEPMTMVGPKLVDGRDGSLWSLGGIQSTWTGKPRHVTRATDGRKTLEAHWLDGAIFAMRRSDFKRIGGVDEKFFLYFEDVELGWRLRQYFSGRVLVLPEVSAEQSPGSALDQYLATRNMIYLLWRQQRWLSLFLFVLETILRLTVGVLLKPEGALTRSDRRFRGLIAGIRLTCSERKATWTRG